MVRRFIGARSRLWLHVIVVALLVFGASGIGFASHPLITDDAGTQGKGKFQLELTGEYGHDRQDGVTTKETGLAATLTYGIVDPVDIVIGLPYQYIRIKDSSDTIRVDGIADVPLDVKWKFYDNEGLSFALKPGVTFSTGDSEKGLGTGKMTYRLFLIGSKEVNSWAFHVNLGYHRNENKAEERKDLWHASVATTYEVAEKWTLVGNLGIERNPDPGSNNHPAFILGGVIYSPAENLDLSCGFKGGLTRSETDYAILLGLTWRF